MTVADNVAYGLRVQGRRQARAWRAGRAALEMMGLAGLGTRARSSSPVDSASGARWLGREQPSAGLLLDEPLGALASSSPRTDADRSFKRIQRELPEAVHIPLC